MKKKDRIYKAMSYLLLLGTLCSPLLISCSIGKSSTMTKRLFMQSKRVNVELPAVENAQKDPSTGAMMLTESVQFKHQDNHSQTLQKDTAKSDLSQMQHLSEVVVTAKARFAPERDGRVSVDFVVRVPKELLAGQWSMNLYPKLLHNDSIVALDALSLKGSEFVDKQKKDYLRFDNYTNSIIPKSAYDSIFLDRKGIARDIRKRQNHYWGLYYTEWKKVMSYQKWRRMIEERYALSNARVEGNKNSLYHSYMRDSEEQTIRLLAVEKDTAGVYGRHMRRFNKRAGIIPQYKLNRELNEKIFPKKYREFYRKDLKAEDLPNHVTTDKDSIQIAKHRYFFHKIALNEMKSKRQQEAFKQIVPFPYHKTMRLDSVIGNQRDFVFYYKQDYPVVVGLKSIRITMDGMINATDRSSYTLAKTDTLSYFISSLAQLADTTLAVKRTKMYRNMFDKQSIYPQFLPNRWEFNSAYKDNKKQIEKLMSYHTIYTKEHGLEMDSIGMCAFSSLDGSYDTNAELSEKRVASLKLYLSTHYPDETKNGAILKTSFRGEDWNTLVALLKKRDDIAHRQEILTLLAQAVYPDDTEKDIKQKYKSDYAIIRDSIYPLLSRIDLTYNLSRNGMTASDSTKIESKDGYQEGLRLLLEREYWKAMEILANYPDYNAALCLACLGYNGKAYDLLVQLPVNGNTEYLMAILCCRLNKEQQAIKHLLNACKMDPSKAYRAMTDPETAALVRNYDLHDKLTLEEQTLIDEPEQTLISDDDETEV